MSCQAVQVSDVVLPILSTPPRVGIVVKRLMDSEYTYNPVRPRIYN